MSSVEESNERILMLEQIPGEETKASNSFVDKRLFESGNLKLKAIQNESSLWELQYTAGKLPPQLEVRFTSFPKLLTYVTDYFKTRGVKVASVI